MTDDPQVGTELAGVEEISIRENRASARFSNGQGVELDWVTGYAVGGVWRIHDLGGQIDG